MAIESDYPTPRKPSMDDDLPSRSSPSASDAGVPDGVPLPPLSRHTPPSPPPSSDEPQSQTTADLERRVSDLQRQEASLKRQIANLQAALDRASRTPASGTSASMDQFMNEALAELEQRKKTLQLSIEQLERRQERIQAEMRTTFAGVSQDLAIRVQGFKDYLVGSLQDLAAAAEQLELNTPQVSSAPSRPQEKPAKEQATAERSPNPQFAKPVFRDDSKLVRDLIDQYRNKPDYYGPPWQLRRTFEPIHAERVSKWFFDLGGRGAVRSTGSRLQNILVASAVISILVELYGERLYTLVLANSPERLGEWRRGLQDCLGISRGDFGAEQGVMLFEAPEPLAQRADRLVQRGQLPLIIVDEAEEVINLSLLQFPLWLTFAPDPTRPPVL